MAEIAALRYPVSFQLQKQCDLSEQSTQFSADQLVRAGKRWCLASIDVTEPLNPEKRFSL